MLTIKRTISWRVGRAWRGKLLILYRMTLIMWMGYWHRQLKKLCKGTYHLIFRRCCFSFHTSQEFVFTGSKKQIFLHEKSVFYLFYQKFLLKTAWSHYFYINQDNLLSFSWKCSDGNKTNDNHLPPYAKCLFLTVG
jgi:hypothetical protein